MSRLLSEIKQQDKYAAAVLEQEGLLTDSDIQTLTREELNELFAGRGYLKLRRTIFEIIHKKKPVDQLLKELKGFIPHESLRDALTNNVVLVDYLHILKDMKTQMNHVQSFLDAHICLLEEFNTNPPDQQSATCGPDPESHNGQPDGRQQGAPGTSTSATVGPKESHHGPTDCGPQGARGTSTSATDGPVQSLNVQTDSGPQGARDSYSGTGTSGAGGQTVFLTGQTGTSTSATNDPMDSDNGQTDCGPQGARGPSTSATGGPMESLNGQTDVGSQRAPAKLKYRMVVSGKTLGAHLNLMQRVKDQVQNQLQLVERDQDHEITFVFCPISSRIATDVKAAMTDVKVSSDDKPVILVLMHHTREFKYTSPLQTCHYDNKVLLFVNFFFHETIKGFLKCEENNAAVSKIQNELLKRFFPRSKDSRGNPQGMGAGGLTGNTFGRGGGNYRGSDVDSRSSGHSMWSPAWWRGQ